MRSTFEFDNRLTLYVSTNAPRIIHDPQSIELVLERADMPKMRQCSSAGYEQEKVTPPELRDQRLDQATFYGPHDCDRCGCLIVRTSQEDGGHRYDYPEGPIYPNTRWVPHVHRDPGPDKVQTIASIGLTPSHARAVASAILSAATEAKR